MGEAGSMNESHTVVTLRDRRRGKHNGKPIAPIASISTGGNEGHDRVFRVQYRPRWCVSPTRRNT